MLLFRVFNFQQQLLCRPITRRGFQAASTLSSALSVCPRCVIGLGKIELRAGFIQRIQRHHRGVLADRSGIVRLRKPQVTQVAVQVSSCTG